MPPSSFRLRELTVKEQINSVIRTAILGVIAAAAGMTAFLFAVVAAFLWTQQRYDSIIASGVVGGMFLLVAVIALIVLFVSRRRAEERQKRQEAAAANAAPSWLADPAVLLTALQVIRTIGLGKLIPIALTGIAAIGSAGVMGSRSAAKEPKVQPKETNRAA
jgi:heme/copper-type cytochrome/quinol oxidase subunit 2